MDMNALLKQLRDVSARLTKVSVKNNYHVQDKVHFKDEMDRNQWFFSPELISIYGSEAYNALTEEQKKQLSFFEAINFFSINIHGEKALLEGLTHQLYENEYPEIDQYIHHFVDEENKHMYLFGNFCQKYAGKIYSDRKINFDRDYVTGEEEFLFYLKVFVFEEIVDYYNVTMGKDHLLEKTCQAINQNHHDDESRHLAFGRVMINYLFQKHKEEWGEELINKIRSYIIGFYQMTWREYYNPDIYQDVGISGHYQLAEATYNSAIAQEYRARVSRSSIQYLLKCGILSEEIKI